MTDVTVLVIYYSRKGSTAEIARHVARGIEGAGAVATMRTVPAVSATTEASENAVPADGPPYATLDDLRGCDALVLGSPTRFGNMAAPLKYFLDSTSELWLAGAMVNKPAGLFTSSTSMHGGQESTLISMAIPLIHHGMIWVGVPYTLPELFETTGGGSPYGASHVSLQSELGLTDAEKRIASELGARVANIAAKLKP